MNARTIRCRHCDAESNAAAQRCRDCHKVLDGPRPESTKAGYSGIIPTKNPAALTAYYLGIFALIPFLGILLGSAAVVLGLKGLAAARERPEIKGKVHAWVGILAGGLFGLAYLLLLLWIIVAA